MKKHVPAFTDHLTEKALNNFLPKTEKAYSSYFETIFHYLGGSHHTGAIDQSTLVKWIEGAKKSGLTVEILSKDVGSGKTRILHHRKIGTSGDFNLFNSNFIDLYDNLQVKTQSKNS
jgi:hypothetical protein